MIIKIREVFGINRTCIRKLKYDEEFDFAVWGDVVFDFSTGKETFMGFYFSEFYRTMKHYLNSGMDETGYYDVDDFGEDYRSKNNPLIKFKRMQNNTMFSFRWIDNVYIVSNKELIDCFSNFEREFFKIVGQKGNIENKQVEQYFNL